MSESGWGGGAGLQIVHLLTEGDSLGKGDNLQGAFEPFVGYNSAGMFARLGYVIAIDSPLGLGTDSGLLKVASFRLALGAKF